MFNVEWIDRTRQKQLEEAKKEIIAEAHSIVAESKIDIARLRRDLEEIQLRIAMVKMNERVKIAKKMLMRGYLFKEIILITDLTEDELSNLE